VDLVSLTIPFEQQDLPALELVQDALVAASVFSPLAQQSFVQSSLQLLLFFFFPPSACSTLAPSAVNTLLLAIAIEPTNAKIERAINVFFMMTLYQIYNSK
jgi:hypothetical protein